MTRILLNILIIIAFSLNAFASNLKEDYDEFGVNTASINDPLESINRGFYQFNKTIDSLILEPTSKFYKAILPNYLKDRVDNAFVNMSEPVSMINHLLQGNFNGFLHTFSRFLVNSTVGIFGIMDVAGSNGMKVYKVTFSDTMVNSCISSGIYLVLPILGPSSARDGFAKIVDSASDPFNYSYVMNSEVNMSLKGLLIVHNRDKYSQYIKDVKDLSFDEYTMVKSIYAQKQKKLNNCKIGK